ncbi:hypothetical protein JL720_10712 [Aureococcus anophagefferens]|nr:hypothetical protein JL720_10712 [Aureococcus anophagefferens]
MDGAVAYAAVEHVAWEARIGWGESSDEGSEGEPERAYRASAPGNAYLDAGDWAGAVRWGGDGESDDERRGGAARAPAPRQRRRALAAFAEPGGRRKRKRERGAGAARLSRLPRAAHSLPAQLHRFSPATRPRRPGALPPPRSRDALRGAWTLAAPRADRAGGAARRYAALQEPIAAFHVARVRVAATPREAAARDRRALDEIQRALFCNTHVPAALLKRAVADVAEKLGGPSGAAVAVRALGRRCAAARKRAGDPARARARARRPTIALAATAGATTPRRRAAADRRAKTLERRLGAARRVHEEIGLAPAHLTSGFVDARIRGANFAILRLGGLGDPSGVGAGFSFARASLAQFRSAASRTGAGGAEKPASLAESRDAYQAQIALVAAAQRRALKRTLADMARGDDDEADDGRLLLEALRRDLKDQEERKRDAAARDALRGESGEPEAIRGRRLCRRYAVRRVSRTFAGGREKPAAGRAEPRGGKKKTVITFSAQALADAEKDGGPAPKAKKGSVKLNISSLMAKHDEHKAEQRRAKEQRMKDDAASYHRRPAPSRRTAPRQGGARRTSPTRASAFATRC